MKNILDEIPEPKPAATTLATLLKRMIDKKFVGYKQHGCNREYYPLVEMTDYCSHHLNGMIKDFFNNSTAQFASFFTTKANFTEKELDELRKSLTNRLKRSSNDSLYLKVKSVLRHHILTLYDAIGQRKHARFQTLLPAFRIVVLCAQPAAYPNHLCGHSRKHIPVEHLLSGR